MSKWNTAEDALTSMQKTIKRRQKVALVINSGAVEGEVYDPLKDCIIKIDDAATSTLNRISKSLNAMYKSMEVKDTRRNIILSKKIEIEAVLSNRK
jgi:hypothetical protein